METVLFITNKIFIDLNEKEGGVRLCTLDYIKLLKTNFKVQIFELNFNTSFFFKIKAKFGIDVFNDYKENDYLEKLVLQIKQNNITKVFINLSSASALSKSIKFFFGDSVKIILCSHGIEAGDFLHHSVRVKNYFSKIKQFTSAWKLGKILQRELEYRIENFDLILTVSEIELAIEYWIGAKQVFFVPRVFEPNFLNWQPILGRVGFIGDVSHYPNYYGLLQLCKSIEKTDLKNNIQLVIVGKKSNNIEQLTNKYSFINYLGYLDNHELETEASTWMFFLNLVFYYSKGVSTKLAKGMNWGLPIISTIAGNRGYVLSTNDVITCETPQEIVEQIEDKMKDIKGLNIIARKIKEAVNEFKSYDDIMNKLEPILMKL